MAVGPASKSGSGMAEGPASMLGSGMGMGPASKGRFTSDSIAMSGRSSAVPGPVVALFPQGSMCTESPSEGLAPHHATTGDGGTRSRPPRLDTFTAPSHTVVGPSREGSCSEGRG